MNEATTGYIDSHAHLYFDRFDSDRAAVIARARAAGFGGVINIGIDLATTRKAIDLAAAYPGFCWASAGIHPTESEMSAEELRGTLDALRELVSANADSVRAIGEIGLDYHWDRATPAAQARAFHAQLELAEDLELPAIIHCRDAMADTLAIVAVHAARVRGVFHCFAGGPAEAQRAQALGWYVSFAGNVTFPKARELHEAARAVAPERLLLETDAPFLAPQPVRGQRNEPAFALHILRWLADLHAIDSAALGATTRDNARTLFALP